MQIGPYEALRPLVGVGIGQSFLCRTRDAALIAGTLLSADALPPGVTVDTLVGLAATLQRIDLQQPSGAYRVETLPDGGLLFVSPFDTGSTLSSMLAARTGDAIPGAAAIFGRLAALLARAHAANVHHLRLSPAQVVVDSRGGNEQVLVSLLGLGLVPLFSSLLPQPTEAGRAYLAPELCAGLPSEPTARAAADIYALGTMLADCLGLPATSPTESASQPLAGSDALPEALKPLLHAMLSRDPSARPAAIDVAQTLQQAMGSLATDDWQAKLAGHLHTIVSPAPQTTGSAAPITSSNRPSTLGSPVPGMLLGNFRLIRQIGEGGMGVVYEAEHCEIGHRAAVKVLHPEFAEDRDQAQRFLNEARAVNIIRHPGLVEIFEQGQRPDGTLYIVMEYLEGQSLRQWLSQRDASKSIPTIISLGLQLARALSASHEKGIVHRDLKPENIMLIPDPVRPGVERAKILDFGIAKLQRRSTPGNVASRVKTESGAMIGTPLYMAPEQFGQAESVNGSADVFALGVILYELATGRMPYQDSSIKLLNEPLVPIRKSNQSVPKKFAALVERMLSLGESARPRMAEVARELASLEQQQQATAGKPLRYALLGGGLVSLLLGGGYALQQRTPGMTPAQARALARQTLQNGVQARVIEEQSAAVSALGKSRDPGQSALLEPLLDRPPLAAVTARALGSLGAVSAQASLLRLLEQASDEPTRMEAASALLQLSHPKGVVALRALLQSRDPLMQIEAALRLLEHGDLSGAPSLRRLIEASGVDAERAIPVLATLARLGDVAARQKLEALAASPALANDPLLLYSLAKLGAEDARQRLQAGGANGSQAVLATRLLASLGDCPPTAQSLLLATIADDRKPDATRQIAVEGLADCEHDDAVVPLAHLITATGSAPSEHRLGFAAAAAILRLFVGQGAQAAERSLAWSHMALGSDSGATRELAVELLGVIDTESSVPPLRQALHDGEREVRRGAAQALGKKLMRTALQALLDSLSDADDEVRSTGMHAIGQVVGGLRHRGDAEADGLVLGPLDRAAQSQNESDRIVASGVLLRLGQGQHRDTLRAGATSKTPKLRQLAVELTEELGVLRQALSDDDPRVRFVAAQRLAQRDDAEAKPVLRAFLTTPGVEAVLAFGLLRRLGEATVEPPDLVGRVVRSTAPDRAMLLGLVPQLPPALAQRLLLALSSDAQASHRQRVASLAYDLYRQTGSGAFRQVLLGLRDDSSPAVQLTVAQLLSRPVSPPASAERGPAASIPALPSPDLSVSQPPADLGEIADAVADIRAGAAPTAEGAPADKASENVQAKAEALLRDARAAITAKQYAQALRLIDRARRVLGRSANKSPLVGEALWLTGTAQELSGKWREAMAAYSQFEKLGPAQRSADATKSVNEATARLKKKMGQIQIFTSRNGQCVLSDSYYLPAGEHIIGLGRGETRAVNVDAGLVTAVRQCE